jgi:3-phytase
VAAQFSIRLLLCGLIFAATATSDPTITVHARGQTEPVAETGDAADDPAIWVHPSDPSRSLILGTDKKDGLNIYDLDGRLLSIASPGSRPNNVDVIYDFSLNGKNVDLAVAGCRARDALGVKLWAIDPERLTLTDVTAGGLIACVAGEHPYGSAIYHSRKDGRFYFFINDKTGRVEQYALNDAGDGKVGAKLVRTLKLPSEVEGSVADDELGVIYIAEERVGIWKFDAEAGGSEKGTLITRVGEHGLTADVEGLTIYTASKGRGYLLASSQGSSTFNVYQREGENQYVATLVTTDAGDIDAVNHTDGIAVTNCPLGGRYPKGLLVIQDGETPGGRQNFKLFAWEDIAGDRLLIDTSQPARESRPGAAHAEGR